MSLLDENWVPAFGTIFTWLAMDKTGKIAVMVNNCFGDLPKCLLKVNKVELLLDKLTEYMWEESQEFIHYPKNKNGDFLLDLYSSWRNRHNLSRHELIEEIHDDFAETANFSDANLTKK
ncbi:hypothetical protein [Xenorhabdus szentirmaii]|uniref:hypothetical protein n=1 Tax=Xenorhabdus szentirmaii TaxID=290112 RepID=UPI002B404780|nr:hypothetical protein [Xenorhabdus sp. M]